MMDQQTNASLYVQRPAYGELAMGVRRSLTILNGLPLSVLGDLPPEYRKELLSLQESLDALVGRLS
jgi:hypothetical protein